ncbi:azurin [Coralloluteibacterium stylophorae]|uniref:Azurin n=1 Tax=Coralloluteibacterium stylophorae TaxID=1776034 RepID=A0A8J7VWF1_9GAMM|nr:azurin [Coralloluteibacterium stylophorae]MBS7457560.1 azurin [Coralloluteibacterium stylophorae]
MIRKILFTLLAAAAAPAAYAADGCSVQLTGDDALKFSLAQIEVPASCDEFTIDFQHVGKLAANVMGHNVVIARTADVDAVASDGLAVQPDHVKPGDARVVAHTKVIGGGESTSLTFDTSKLEDGGDYSFFCSFPGHSAVMRGKLVAGG